MKTEQEYIKDISEIRSMMERSSKFLSLTGWSGIMAGIYALLGAYLAYHLFYGAQDTFSFEAVSGEVILLIILAISVLLLAIGTSAYLSYKKAKKNNDVIWNSVARRMVSSMAIPLLTGGAFVLILISQGALIFIAPVTLIFYGLSIINASQYTFTELKSLGIAEIILGLFSLYFTSYGLIFWAVGFGLMHIIYGIFMHLKYEK